MGRVTPWIGPSVALALLCMFAVPIAAQSDGTRLGCGWNSKGERRLEACRAEAAFEPNSVRAVRLDPNYFASRPEERAIRDQIVTALSTPR